jgi:hypothetical protein
MVSARSVESEEISGKNRPKYVKVGLKMKIYLLTMIVNHFPQIVKNLLKGLPKNDYPVLNSRLFVECWLTYTLYNNLTSMRDLFKRINPTGFEVDISTFSKANTHRSQELFRNIYEQLNQLVPKEAHKKLHNNPVLSL